MGRKGLNQEVRKQVQRRLERTKRKLRVAEEELAQAMTEGRQMVEKAKLQAERLQAKAAARVTKQLDRLEQVETQLRPVKKATDMADNNGKQRETTVVPPASVISTALSAPLLPEHEESILQMLRASAGPDGLSGSEWQTLTGLSKTSFSRARARLVAEGLVEVIGPTTPRPRYHAIAAANSNVTPDKDLK
jgi:hypothetical protein